ncbi:LOW QUALITY PROTEIN: uncharacterized protein Dana_GF16754 [Drosophila ananassae]|uniref:Uncharacterized protein n=1 Tax=Drosophila ananassae TaxID=7217 RepID=B3LYP7_DROAN|nr:LOW QUALITY PROTEIN: uncharacterized protein Dana_GF16754 [Drosophila ananassae]
MSQMHNTAFYKSALDAQQVALPPVEDREPNYIDNLHIIFFEQIFEAIDNLSDQVRMARAYPQFVPQILKIWQKHLNCIVGPNTAFLGLLDIEDYVFFMEHMAELFTEMHVSEDGVGPFAEFYDYITHLCDINITRFPQVETCIMAGNPNTVVDDDIRDLTVMLPNLKCLMTCMNLSGVYIRGFRKLEELIFNSLYHSVPLDSRWMQEICLNMTTLKVLDITDQFDSQVRLTDIALNGYHCSWEKLTKLLNIRNQEKNPPPLEVFSELMWANFTPAEYHHWLANKYVQVTCDNSEYEYQEEGFEFDFE